MLPRLPPRDDECVEKESCALTLGLNRMKLEVLEESILSIEGLRKKQHSLGVLCQPST